MVAWEFQILTYKKFEDILETALTENSLAREKQAYLRLGVIGTGSIAKRFVEEAVYGA